MDLVYAHARVQHIIVRGFSDILESNSDDDADVILCCSKIHFVFYTTQHIFSVWLPEIMFAHMLSLVTLNVSVLKSPGGTPHIVEEVQKVLPGARWVIKVSQSFNFWSLKWSVSCYTSFMLVALLSDWKLHHGALRMNDRTMSDSGPSVLDADGASCSNPP